MVKEKSALTISPETKVKPPQESQTDKPSKKNGRSAGSKRASSNKSSDKRSAQGQQPGNRYSLERSTIGKQSAGYIRSSKPSVRICKRP